MLLAIKLTFAFYFKEFTVMVSAQLLIAAVFAFTFIYIWKIRRFIYATYKINGPFVWPVLGNVLEFVGNNEGKTVNKICKPSFFFF